ncbi:DUF4177 domain-containing protein [Alteribacter natronophilus]|uniref:DUF4177 domain-containing protein n=1 Tax=Alteribacter natronophilus TaxID=2583810 RepID=UPI00110DBB5A|nr:DUF4177 domain-containing protein [Alteribacter natronophilus]TMW72325.1 DUF4177 domain-containing protein [Alteribacter natronophilus]
MKQYKTVKVDELVFDRRRMEFETLLNEEAKEGWELHSVVPQVHNGSVDKNVAIFVKDE